MYYSMIFPVAVFSDGCPGYVLYGFEEIAQWHAESNSSIAVNMKRWKSSGSIYFVFAQYRIVSPYHCDTGIEVSWRGGRGC